jgi:hypothetical protein
VQGQYLIGDVVVIVASFFAETTCARTRSRCAAGALAPLFSPCIYCVTGATDAEHFVAAILRSIPDTISGSLASRLSNTRAAPVGTRRLPIAHRAGGDADHPRKAVLRSADASTDGSDINSQILLAPLAAGGAANPRGPRAASVLCDLRHTRPTISGAHFSQITNRATRGRR